MLDLPKKRPWLILVALYVVIVAVWTTFIILGNQQGDRMTPQEAEQYIKEHPKHPQQTTKSSEP